jgi:hypothetical protein
MTKPSRFALISIFILLLGVASLHAQRPADFGKQWVRSHPFSLMGLTLSSAWFDADEYKAAELNTFLCWGNDDQLLPIAVGGDLPWHDHVPQTALTQQVQDDITNAVGNYPGGTGLMVNDEPVTIDMANTVQIMDWIKTNYPDMLVYSNAWPIGAASGDEYYGAPAPPGYGYSDYLTDFISILQPDVMCYDMYPFGDPPGVHSGFYFTNLMVIRNLALQAGIPYWAFLQSYEKLEGSHQRRLSSESDLRFQMFSMLSAGYTGFLYFTYDKFISRSLLDVNGDPTPLYYAAQLANPEVENVGQAIRFLESTDVRFIRGQSSPGSWNTTPGSLTNWSSGAGGDSLITSISVDFSAPQPYGQWKDGLIGFFTDDDSNPYFMLTNLYHFSDMTAADTALSFIVTFDSSVNELLRLSRFTGHEEVVPLTNHTLTIELPGGTGDLFKYNTGPFVGVPRCGDAEYRHYLPTDMNRDCKVNMKDFSLFTDNWLDCTDPDPPCSYLP